MQVDEREDSPIAGFTLIEVIVAFVVLALVLGSVTLSISYSGRLYHRADQVTLAGDLAERVIAERFNKVPQQLEHESGSDGSLRWTVERRVLADDFTGKGGRLMEFDLELLDTGGRVVDHYETLYVERQR
jgi:type II secretory pathway pseudopilin PulG